MSRFSRKQQCEFLRQQAKERFDKVREAWETYGRWALPHRTAWLRSQNPGERKNQHIVDGTHILALRSYVAGFLEGNTSVTRPWYRIGTGNRERDLKPANHEWLDLFTRRTLNTLSRSNFYHAAAIFYADYGVFNTGAYFIEEELGNLFFHNLIPGSYYVINDDQGEAVVLVREMSLNVKAVVDQYAPFNEEGTRIWSNISDGTRKLYDDGDYTEKIHIVQAIKHNENFNPAEPIAGKNRRWVSLTYELGAVAGFGSDAGDFNNPDSVLLGNDIFLRESYSTRKPFVVGRSTTSNNFEYGEKGPTSDALGIIRSLNKKAISKDQALEQIIKPALQGPANLRKSYITTAANSYIPLDPTTLSKNGLKPVFEISPAIQALVGDQEELRRMVDKFYYADFLLFLSSNPKTRTATETDAIVKEQQLVIGPNLQSLNFTHNLPLVDFLMDFQLNEDPFLPEPPDELTGEFLQTEFISVFAQAQRAADLPAVDRYLLMASNVAQFSPSILDKVNTDEVADIYADRLYLPPGLNNPKERVEALRAQAQAQAERQAKMEQLSQIAGAAKDVGLKAGGA